MVLASCLAEQYQLTGMVFCGEGSSGDRVPKVGVGGAGRTVAALLLKQEWYRKSVPD